MPAGSVRLTQAAAPGQLSLSSSNSAAKVSTTSYWRTPLDRAATFAWFGAHLERTWSGGAVGISGGTTIEAEYDQHGHPGTPGIEGPVLEVSIQDVGGGSSVIITAYEIPLPVKSPAQILTGVTAVTVWTKDAVAGLDVTPLRQVTLPADTARRLAGDVNELTADDGSPRSCPIGMADVVLDFTTASGPRRWVFDRNCGSGHLVPAQGPELDVSSALDKDLKGALAGANGPARGTLIVVLSIAKRPYDPASAPRTIAVTRQNSTVDRTTISSGRSAIMTEPTGSYQVTAVSGHLHCRSAKVTVLADQQTDVTLVRGPRPK